MKTMLNLIAVATILVGSATYAKSAAALSQAALQQAMRDCENMYRSPRRGRRSGLENFVYAYIERCFKIKTGMYPAQANINCNLRRC